MEELEALDGLPLDDLLEDVLEYPIVPPPSGTIVNAATAASFSHRCECWGSAVSGAPCTPSFVLGEGHFKNKFCPRCRSDGIDVEVRRLCILTPALGDAFSNSNGRAVYTDDARLVNQTIKCSGPRIAIFRLSVPPELQAASGPIPSEWLRHHDSGAAYVHFAVKLGTLVPVARYAAGLPRAPSATRQEGAAAIVEATAKRPLEGPDASGPSRRCFPAAHPRSLPAAEGCGAEGGAESPSSEEAAIHTSDGTGAGTGTGTGTGTSTGTGTGTGTGIGTATGTSTGTGAWSHAASSGAPPAPIPPRPMVATAVLVPSVPGASRLVDPSSDAEDVEADLVLVARLLGDPHFQRAQCEQLLVSAGCMGCLDAHGKVVMHRMFCDSAMRALASAASEDRINRVIQAVYQGGHQLGQIGSPLLSLSDQAQLSTFCACILDVGAWEDRVRATAATALTSSSERPVSDGRLTGGETEWPAAEGLELITASLEQLEVRSQGEGGPCGFGGEWRRRVQRSFARMQKVLQASEHWETIVDEKGMVARLCNTDGQLFFHFQSDILWEADAAASPTELSLRARAMMRALSESERMQVHKVVGEYDEIVEFDPKASGPKVGTLGLLERALYSLWGKFAVRQVVTPLSDGCQCIQVEWDIERDQALHLDRSDELLSNLTLLRFNYDRDSRHWRISLADIAPIAPPEWLTSSRLLHAPIFALLRMSAKPFIERMVRTMRNHLRDHAALPSEPHE